VLDTAQTRAVLEAIDTSTIVGLRDRALIAVVVYSFARVSAVIGMRVEDYYPNGKR
jgi:site-specific recombinase XerD